MRFVLDHGRWIVVTLLLLGGLVVASVCSGGADHERTARLGRLQTFVAAMQKKAAQVNRPRPFSDLVPACDEPAELGVAAASAFLGDLRGANEMLAEMEEPSAQGLRAALRPCLEPIVQALRRAAGGGLSSDLIIFPGRVLLVAFLEAGDRAAWSEQVELWLVMRALPERSKYPSSGRVAPFWPDDRVTCLDAAALRQLASAIAHVDAKGSLSVDAPSALVNWLAPLLDRPAPTNLRRRLTAWRHGFDTHERELVAADELLAALPELADGDCVWDVREQQWQRFFAAVRSGAGALLPRYLDGLREEERSLRRELAQLRLLRLCIAWRLGEPLPAVLDPFTLTPFVVEANGDAATFRSPSTQPDLVRGATRLGAAEQR
jgi:hypothetical protein